MNRCLGDSHGYSGDTLFLVFVYLIDCYHDVYIENIARSHELASNEAHILFSEISVLVNAELVFATYIIITLRVK